MDFGAFSMSLNVKNLQHSRDFYEKLDFQVIGGEISDNWLIMRNKEHTIGLYYGMFNKNIMTFNPGWDKHCKPLDAFTDIRELQKKLHERGIEFDSEAEAGSSGPASFIIVDPDGNPILVDQHIDS